MQRLQDQIAAMEESKTSLEEEAAKLREELQAAREENSKNVRIGTIADHSSLIRIALQVTALTEEQLKDNALFQAIVSKAAALTETNRELLATSETRNKDLTELKQKYEEEVATLEVRIQAPGCTFS